MKTAFINLHPVYLFSCQRTIMIENNAGDGLQRVPLPTFPAKVGAARLESSLIWLFLTLSHQPAAMTPHCSQALLPGLLLCSAALAPAEHISPDNARNVAKYRFSKKQHKRGNNS